MGEYLYRTVMVFCIIWACWAALNILLLTFTPQRAKRHGIDVYVTGVLRPHIYMSPEVRNKLTDPEYDAVMAHEFGHIVRGHLWKNFLVAIFCPWYRSTAMMVRQELEADNYAVLLGKGAALASALRKLSYHEFDWKRAELIEKHIARMTDVAVEKSFGREALNRSAPAGRSEDIIREG